MLIPFPIAFLSSATLVDAIGWASESPALWTAGRYLSLAGIATALLAAIPGFIDYVYTVPPASSGRRRATRHLAFNLTAVTLYAAAWWIRSGLPPQPVAAVVGLEAVALVLLGTGGFMGGTLVTRNLIGVDHRYAGAGKWREATIEPGEGGVVTVANRDELQVDQMKLLHVGNRRIVLARTSRGYRAFDDRCTHRGGSLAGGVTACGTVQCLWHGSQFDVETGSVKAGPAEAAVRSYQVREEDGQVRLALGQL
jgi:nitrite reductase/ring-hydroxylating ferredoxin subunit/uncharacterized membrane protein